MTASISTATSGATIRYTTNGTDPNIGSTVYSGSLYFTYWTYRGASGFGAAAAMPLLGLVIPLKILVPAWTLIGIAAGAAGGGCRAWDRFAAANSPP